MFTESNTVEAFLRDLLCSMGGARRTKGIAEPIATYGARRLAGAAVSTGWRYVEAAKLPRKPQEVFVEPFVAEALARLNPEIAQDPDRADEVLYKLRASAFFFPGRSRW